MLKFIETEIDGKECSFHVRINVTDASFSHALGVEHKLDYAFEILGREGCDETQAQAYCEARAGKLIDLALQDIADREEARQVDRQLAY
jgi:hypothetical protein